MNGKINVSYWHITAKDRNKWLKTIVGQIKIILVWIHFLMRQWKEPINEAGVQHLYSSHIIICDPDHKTSHKGLFLDIVHHLKAE